MRKITDASDRFFERYRPAPGSIIIACLRWLISGNGSEVVSVVIVVCALIVGLVYGPEWAARSFEVVGR